MVSRVINRGDNNLYLISLTDGSEALLTPHEGPGSFLGGGFAPDGRTVYLASNKDGDRLAFARVSIDERGQPGPVEVLAARADAELSGGAMNDQGTVIALIWNVAGRSELSLYDVQNHRIDRITVPTIVLHGANDTNVPVVEAEQVVAQLQKRHVPVEYVLFPDEGHGWRKLPNRIRSAVAIVRFFETYLTTR